VLFRSTLTLAAQSSSIRTDKSNSMTLSNLTFTALSPTVKRGYINLSVGSFFWDWDETDERNSVFSVGDYGCKITSIPTWLTVIDGTLHARSVGYSVSDGDTLGFYPTEAQYGGALSGNVVFKDTNPNALNKIVRTLAVSQAVYPSPPIVNIYDDGTFIMSDKSYGVWIGSSDLDVSFTHDLVHNTWKQFRVSDAGGNTLWFGSGFPDGIFLRVDGSATKSVSLSRLVVAGDVLTVQVGII